tara:strand:- start:2105 stop:3145 length:1041 start_codon:yes stop_codon:yes gene_type:complete
MLSIQNIIDDLKNQGVTLDLNQIDLLQKLSKLHNRKKSIFNNKNNNQGIYVWGDVGRGKTMIIQSFLRTIQKKDFTLFHYIDFINFIHNELNNYSGFKNPLKKISKKISKENKLIFIDEFQVEDVADAMIIGDLLISFMELGTRIILTSNAHPDDLYKNGLQRQKFLKSINILKDKIEIYKLEGNIDYRSRNIIELNKKNIKDTFSDKKISELIKQNFSIDEIPSDTLVINKRKFKCKIVLNNLLWIEFSSFFKEATGAQDYKFICDKFDWIFISSFSSNDDHSIDVIRRFISFIDIAYKEKTKVKFFFNDLNISSIYSGRLLDLLWKRCASRLVEMQNYDYLDND